MNNPRTGGQLIPICISNRLLGPGHVGKLSLECRKYASGSHLPYPDHNTNTWGHWAWGQIIPCNGPICHL